MKKRQSEIVSEFIKLAGKATMKKARENGNISAQIAER